MAGARYMSVDTQIDFQGGLLGGEEVSQKADWIDPLVALRLSHQFNEKWLGVLWGNVGGFGVSSEFVWELFTGLAYQVTDSTSVYCGYRYLDVDYDRDLVFDVEIKGAVVGAEFRF
jgi:opacity protein-like surface antigen